MKGLVVILLATVMNVQGALYSSRSLERELLDLLMNREGSDFIDTRTCSMTDVNDLRVTGPDTPSPITVNECIDGDLYSNDYNCNHEMNVEDCTNSCVLGHKTDEKGCVLSCACKEEGLLEGDIMLSKQDVARMQSVDGNRAASKFFRRWNNSPLGDGNFLVPYTLDATISGNPKAVAAISAAIEEYAKQTCMVFKPRTDEKDYIEIFKGRGCYSYIGRNGGKQQLSIGRGCEYKGIVMHEMLHAMGFWHEHSRPDRDEHVKIAMENVNPKMKNNFEKKKPKDVDSFGSPYDVGSIMQYGGFHFSINRKPTILDRKTGKPIKEQRENFSSEDVMQLNTMYKCKK